MDPKDLKTYVFDDFDRLLKGTGHLVSFTLRVSIASLARPIPRSGLI